MLQRYLEHLYQDHFCRLKARAQSCFLKLSTTVPSTGGESNFKVNVSQSSAVKCQIASSCITHILRVNEANVMTTLVTKLIGVFKMLLEFFLQVRGEGDCEVAPSESYGLSFVAGGLGEGLRDLLCCKPLSVGNQVLARTFSNKCLNERTGVLVMRNPRELQVQRCPY